MFFEIMKFNKKVPNHIRWINEEYRARIKKQFNLSDQRGTKYGLTEEELDDMYKSQDFKCAICGTSEILLKERILAIDHDHDTEKPRGLLCMQCNHGLGNFNDDISLFLNAIEYLRKHADELSFGKRQKVRIRTF